MADTKKIVRINFKAYLEDTGKMFDTNIEACAKENDIYNEKSVYAPMAYVIGSGKLFPAVEEAIASAEVGKEIEVSVPCDKAAGPRNPDLVKLHPLKDFHKAGIDPYPGLPVTFGNRSGVIMSVGAGRVKVDFNKPLAGHDLSYKITVVEEVADPVQKAKAVMEMNFVGADDFGYEISADKVVITESDICKYHEAWPMAKYSLVSAYRGIFGVDRIEFVEVWESAKKPEEKKE